MKPPRTSPRPPKRPPPPMTAAAEEAHAADDGGGDRVQQQRPAADVARDRLEVGGVDDAADPGQRAREREDEQADPGHGDARPAGSLGVSSDRVDVPTERRPR